MAKEETWVGVQKKTFTRWANQFLAERMLKIEDLVEDLKDGVKLCELLEIISSKSVGKFNRQPRLRFHFLENNRRAIEFILHEGLTLVGIGPEDITDGNIKLDLGLIWTLILRYHINVIGGGSPKWELLQWVKKQIEPYNLEKKGDNLKNFTTDWSDGTVLYALADSLKPGVLTPYDMSGLKHKPLVDLEKAMDVSEQEYDIPKLLDAEDIVNNPDELSIMTYVSYFRDYLSNDAARKRAELERKKKTAHPAYCYAKGPGLEGGFTNQPNDFTIYTLNCFGEPLPVGGCEFDVSVVSKDKGGKDPKNAAKIKDNGDGTYAVTYYVEKPGTYAVNVRLTGQKGIDQLPEGHPGWGQHIKDSPYSVKIEGPSANQSFATGPGVEGAVVGKSAPFTIKSRTADGKPITTGGAEFVAKLRGPEPINDIPIVDNSNGTYDGSYVVNTPGRYEVDITLDGAPIKNSPYKLLIEQARAGKSWAEGPGLEPEGNKQYVPTYFTIHAVDPDGKPVTKGGDPFVVVFKEPGDKEGKKLKPEDNKDGTYTVKYTPEKAGPHVIEVSLHDDPIKDSPFKVDIKPTADAGKSWAEGPGLEGAWLDEPAIFTIHAVDAKGNPRKDGGDAFEVDIKGPDSKKVPVKVKDNDDGTYTVEYKADKVGKYDIAVTKEDDKVKGKKDNIKDSPFKVECIKRPADPKYCYAHGPGLEPGNETNQPCEFEIVAKNKHDQPLDFGGNNFKVKITNDKTGEEIPAKVSDNKDGTYPVVYEVKKPGTYTVKITLDGEDIKDTPKKVKITGPDASKSYATGPGVEPKGGAVTDKPNKFKIHAVDADGNPCKTGNDPFKVEVKPLDENNKNEKPVVKLTDNGDGTYDGEYLVNAPGNYEVKVTLDNENIKDSPFKVLVENARAGLSYAEGPGLEGGQQYKEGKFTIYAVDTQGKKRTTGGDPFVVKVKGPEGDVKNVSLKDNNDGTYSVVYVPKKFGDYTVDVTLHGDGIKNNPFKVPIRPSPSAANTWAEGPGLDEAWDNEPAFFTIHAVDEDGNPIEHGGDTFDVKINGPEDVETEIVDNGDGTYSVSYYPQEPGDYTIAVTHEGKNIKDSPFKVKCKEGTDADNSGFGIFSFTIQSRDKRGKQKEFGGDKFEVSIKGPDEADVEVQTLDNEDGTYTAIYALAGDDIKGKTFNVIAKLNGKVVGRYKQKM